MKKTLLLGVLALGSLIAFAQEEQPKNDTQPIVNMVQEEFTEIGKDKLPEAVVKSFEDTYQNSTIDKVFVNESGEYKIEATDSEATAFVVYADKDGNWITKSE